MKKGTLSETLSIFRGYNLKWGSKYFKMTIELAKLIEQLEDTV